MRLINDYTPPTPDDLNTLKESLGNTGNQMADLAGVASNSQWRKYTGGESPRAMSPQARLALTDDELQRVIEKMHDIGAETR
ncbi:XRE family transcriptional regulator [Pectobacterium parmentieri]|uniref:XRE family transcriptional regulator n=1 Tax=Pectobacterium parmentieri TaxID=1905730 RepID=UPI0018E19D55|nr:XRE family transcriptional regulator [Pectobacterium parmentieri]QQA77092.1 XRE family transcriptional regulator [Pectobacterium parmentieri]